MDFHNTKLALGYGDIPSVGLGTFTFHGEQGNLDDVEAAIGIAIDAGYRHFDCAWAYKTQDAVGKMLEKKINEGVIERKDIFITTKLWNTHHNPKLVLGVLKDSLDQLRTSYVDMFLIHFPTGQKDQDYSGNVILVQNNNDFVCYPLEDIWKMERCLHLGLTKNIGLSNFNIEQTKRILDCCTMEPSNIQIEITPYFSNERLVTFCMDKGLVVTAFAPLGCPSYPLNLSRRKCPLEEQVLIDIAKSRGRSVAQVIIRFHIQNGICVVPKSVTPSRIRENINVFDFVLSQEEMQIIKSLNRNQRLYMQHDLKEHPEYPFDEPL